MSASIKAARFEDLPAEARCAKCGDTKPLAEMVIYRSSKEHLFCVRSCCKECQNTRERGHRREYKRAYLNRWRKANADVIRSYWDNDDQREKARLRQAGYLRDPQTRDAVAIQRRLRTRGESVTIAEARELLAQYGRCYPSRFGLTTKGLKECERIRARLRMRRKKRSSFGWKMPTSFEIRLMVYEQSLEEPGLVIPPEEQPVPYQKAARTMARTQGRFRSMRAVA